jgi:hypothetical protein
VVGAFACGELHGVPGTGDDSDINADAGENDPPDDAAAGMSPDAPAAGHRYVFVSATTGVTGGFAGGADPYAVADGICLRDLFGSSLPNARYHAFLKGMQPLQPGVPWYLPSGKMVFDGATPPTPGANSTPPMSPIQENVHGATTGGEHVWTGADGKDCSGWTSSAATSLGGIGDPFSDSAAWDDDMASECAYVHRFYCFEE